jgi:mono/diheme cytochrome c family protein
MQRPLPLLLLFLVPLVGCGPDVDPPYEPAWKFPPRTDPVVVALPTVHPTGRPDEPDKLDEQIASLGDIGGKVVLPSQLPEDQRQRLITVLDQLFGTPAAPAVDSLGEVAERKFLLNRADLLAGAKHYKVKCANCHGMTGDGRGTGGLWSFPHPRDFRSGKFKLATGAGANTGRPRFTDLKQVILKGVPGTLMQGTTEADVQVSQLAAYTVFLSVRGEVEMELLKALADPDEGVTDIEAEAKKRLAAVLKKWTAADEETPLTHAVQPRPDEVTAEYAESVRRGQKLFVSQRAGCASCHTDYGRTPTYRYDVWGVPNRVRNLTEKERQWAREPADFARQLKNGLHAANMPAVPVELTDQDIADLVHFVRELPFPQRLPDDVRRQVEPVSK